MGLTESHGVETTNPTWVVYQGRRSRIAASLPRTQDYKNFQEGLVQSAGDLPPFWRALYDEGMLRM